MKLALWKDRVSLEKEKKRGDGVPAQGEDIHQGLV